MQRSGTTFVNVKYDEDGNVVTEGNNEEGETRNIYRGRGRGDRGNRGRGRGEYRGSRGDRGQRGRGGRNYQFENNYYTAENNHGEEQIDSASSASVEYEQMTREEEDFVNERIENFKNDSHLKDLVNADQIEKKCIDLDFDPVKFDSWAASLVQTDKRLQGLADFEWNETETKEEKRAKRLKTINDAKEAIRAEKR